MPFDDVDGSAPGAHGTNGAARHRKNANKQSNIGASTDCSDTPAYTDEQYEAVKRYMLSVRFGNICSFCGQIVLVSLQSCE